MPDPDVQELTLEDMPSTGRALRGGAILGAVVGLLIVAFIWSKYTITGASGVACVVGACVLSGAALNAARLPLRPLRVTYLAFGFAGAFVGAVVSTAAARRDGSPFPHNAPIWFALYGAAILCLSIFLSRARTRGNVQVPKE